MSSQEPLQDSEISSSRGYHLSPSQSTSFQDVQGKPIQVQDITTTIPELQFGLSDSEDDDDDDLTMLI